MAVFWIVFLREINLAFSNLGKAISGTLFFVISITTFLLILQDQAFAKNLYFTAIILFSLLSCIIFYSAEFLKNDFEDGTIEQVLLSIENFEIFILAKILGNWFICCFPIIILVILALILNDFEQKFTVNFVLTIFTTTLIINFICAFCGSLSIFGNSASVIGVIAYPLIIPVILISYESLINGFDENSWNIIQLLGGIAIFAGCFAILAITKIIKIANE